MIIEQPFGMCVRVCSQGASFQSLNEWNRESEREKRGTKKESIFNGAHFRMHIIVKVQSSIFSI